jgi:hypothetical protein
MHAVIVKFCFNCADRQEICESFLNLRKDFHYIYFDQINAIALE